MADMLTGEIEKFLKDLPSDFDYKDAAVALVSVLTDDALIDEISARNYLVDKSKKDKVDPNIVLTDTEQALFDRGYDAGFEGRSADVSGEPGLVEFYKMGYKAGDDDRKAVDASGSSNT